MKPPRRYSATLLAIALVASGAPLSAQTRGWHSFYLPETQGTASRYLPPEIDLAQDQPLIVFLHGAGGHPEAYRPFVIDAARELGVAVVLPRSSTPFGWGLGNDRERVTEAVDVMKDLIPVDPRRVGIAGHSAGGGWALLLGFAADSPYNAIFQMSSPFVSVTGTPEGYLPPLHQYYGTEDPNFHAARDALNAQWAVLDLTVTERIAESYGHSDWPDGTLEGGFSLLLDTVRPPATLPGAEPPPPPCGDATTLCLLDRRFEVRVEWRDHHGNEGPGRTVEIASPDSGLFWFFDADNWEMLVKLVDGCALNGHVWVFAAATTDVAYDLEVTERQSGAVRSYSNPLGVASPAITDTTAFPCSQPPFGPSSTTLSSASAKRSTSSSVE